MIQPNELRIGNFVYVENYKSHPNLINEPVKVVGIKQRNELYFPKSEASISMEVDKYNGLSQFNEFINPIPLTEEWLIKFGFKYSGNGFYINVKSLLELANIGNEFFHAGFKSISLCDIYYVHQLQNLYFALTGKELTTNL